MPGYRKFHAPFIVSICAFWCKETHVFDLFFTSIYRSAGISIKSAGKSITLTPEKAQESLDQAQAQLANIFVKQKTAHAQYPDFIAVRICVECEKLYQLNT
jgi:hypothetical protein